MRNSKIEGRMMPHSIEGEQSVLGCVLIDTDAGFSILSNLKDNDFYVEIVAKNGFTRRFTWCQYRFYLFHKSAYNDLRVKLRVWCGECNLALSRYREIELAELEKALEEL
jgi:hypothetical protein